MEGGRQGRENGCRNKIYKEIFRGKIGYFEKKWGEYVLNMTKKFIIEGNIML